MTFLPIPRDLPGCTLLALPREVDLSNAVRLFAAITDLVDARAHRLRVLVLDLTGTDFMDSQGVRLVDDLRVRLRPHTELRVAATPDGVPTRILKLTGLRRDVPVYDNLAEAVVGGPLDAE